MSAWDAVKDFRSRLDQWLNDDATRELRDETWWDDFGELLDDVLAARACAKRAEREATRCTATRSDWTQCVRQAGHTGNHSSPTTGRWKNESMSFAEAERIVVENQRAKQERWRSETARERQ